MSARASISLSDFITLQRGFDLPAALRKDGDVPVIASTGIAGYHNEAKVLGPGVVIGRSGSIGGGQYIVDDFWPLNTTLWVKDFKGNNPRFVYYLLRSIDFSRFNSGAGVPTLNRNHIASLRVPKFRPVEQEQVASILSAYDDLIENNRRRIQLLEQAARLLYKEWFTPPYRYPGAPSLHPSPKGRGGRKSGHEHAKIKDGVPEGWEKKPLGEVAPLKYEKALVPGPAIIVGRKGNVGSVYWCEDDFHPIDTVYYIDRENCSLLLYYSLLHTPFISTDVAVPGLNRDFAHSRKILIPEAKIQRIFEETVAPIHRQIHGLHKYDHALAEARDLLLSRLMNGEVAA